jgi:protein-disulfide isomerase
MASVAALVAVAALVVGIVAMSDGGSGSDSASPSATEGTGGTGNNGGGATTPSPDTNYDTPPQVDGAIPLADVAQVPRNTQPDGGIRIGTDRAAGGPEAAGAPTLGVFLDYMCGHCETFETTNLQAIEEMIAAGEVNFVIYPVAILDRATPETMFSTRAVATTGFIADQAPEFVLDWHEALFTAQPRAVQEGFTNAQLAELAQSVGVPAEVTAQIADGTAVSMFAQWATSATRAGATGPAAGPDGGFGTPTLLINGARADVAWNQPGSLREAILNAS